MTTKEKMAVEMQKSVKIGTFSGAIIDIDWTIISNAIENYILAERSKQDGE